MGVRCSDGVVIGCDSIATSSAGPFELMHIPFDGKIQVFEDSVILATTGSIGYAQRLGEQVAAAVKGNVFRNFDAREATNNISKRFLTDLQSSMAPRHTSGGLRFGSLIAAHVKNGGLMLAEFGPDDFQPELKTEKIFFVSMGSGQVLADPFLAFVTRIMWKNTMPTVDEAKFGVYWVLDHTLRLAPGKVGPPIRLFALRDVAGKWVAAEQDTQEFGQYVQELEDHIGKFIRAPIEEATTTPVPQAPTAPDPAEV